MIASQPFKRCIYRIECHNIPLSLCQVLWDENYGDGFNKYTELCMRKT